MYCSISNFELFLKGNYWLGRGKIFFPLTFNLISNLWLKSRLQTAGQLKISMFAYVTGASKILGLGPPFWKFKFQKCPHIFANSSHTVWPTIKVEYSADCWDPRQNFKPSYRSVTHPQAAVFKKPLAWPISQVPTKGTLPWNKSCSTHQKWMVEVCAGSWYVYQFFKPSNTVLSL